MNLKLLGMIGLFTGINLMAQLENPSDFIQTFNSAQQLMNGKLATLESILIKANATVKPTPEEVTAFRNDLNTILQQISEREDQVSDLIGQIPNLAWDQDFKALVRRSGESTQQLLDMLKDKITKVLEQL
jgi:ABC-type transporter Mla subunit MlaD